MVVRLTESKNTMNFKSIINSATIGSIAQEEVESN
jgi:hypothetical protein